RADRHAEVLARGWRYCKRVGKDGAAGWEMKGRNAQLRVPLRGDTLVLQGWAQRPGRTVTLRVQGRKKEGALAVEHEGPFEVRMPLGARRADRASAGAVDVEVTGGEPDPEAAIVVTAAWSQ